MTHRTVAGLLLAIGLLLLSGCVTWAEYDRRVCAKWLAPSDYTPAMFAVSTVLKLDDPQALFARCLEVQRCLRLESRAVCTTRYIQPADRDP